MEFQSALDSMHEAGVPAAVRSFGTALNAEWVDAALHETGTATVRRRRLPAESVVWVVIAMALFRNCSIKTVVAQLGLALPSFSLAKGKSKRTVAGSAVAQSRERLGDRPLQAIFERSAETWAEAAADADRWRGLALYGVDGSTLKLADTEDNEAEFGRPGSRFGESGYPQLRLVVLMALRSHLVRGAAMGRCRGKASNEQKLARELWPHVPEHSLTILDKGFLSYGALYDLHHDEAGAPRTRHWLVPAKSNLTFDVLKVLGKGDELVQVPIRRIARQNYPHAPRTMQVRVVNYQVEGGSARRLFTSMLDPERYPASEIATLYHERWEIELGYGELKTQMLERKESLRSKKPTGVRQEVWGILIAYNLVRLKMLEAAELAGVAPTRISFKNSLHLIRVFSEVNAWVAPAGTMPTQLEMLLEMLAVLVLPERRPKRRYKRHVKVIMSKFKRNPSRAASLRTQRIKELK